MLLGRNSLESRYFKFFKQEPLRLIILLQLQSIFVVYFLWPQIYHRGRCEGAFSAYSYFYFVLYAIELSKTDPFYMDIETYGILLQNVYSVLPLQFTALISKARKAYD